MFLVTFLLKIDCFKFGEGNIERDKFKDKINMLMKKAVISRIIHCWMWPS